MYFCIYCCRDCIKIVKACRVSYPKSLQQNGHSMQREKQRLQPDVRIHIYATDHRMVAKICEPVLLGIFYMTAKFVGIVFILKFDLAYFEFIRDILDEFLDFKKC